MRCHVDNSDGYCTEVDPKAPVVRNTGRNQGQNSVGFRIGWGERRHFVVIFWVPAGGPRRRRGSRRGDAYQAVRRLRLLSHDRGRRTAVEHVFHQARLVLSRPWETVMPITAPVAKDTPAFEAVSLGVVAAGANRLKTRSAGWAARALSLALPHQMMQLSLEQIRNRARLRDATDTNHWRYLVLEEWPPGTIYDDRRRGRRARQGRFSIWQLDRKRPCHRNGGRGPCGGATAAGSGRRLRAAPAACSRGPGNGAVD